MTVIPDPTDSSNLGYNTIEFAYDKVAQAVIETPQRMTGKGPVLSYAGDITSDVLSTVFKDVGIVGDHFLMKGGQAADLVENVVEGSAGILVNIASDPHDLVQIWDNDGKVQTAGGPDDVQDVLSNVYSYAVNNLEGHLHHDIDLFASPVDLAVDLLRSTERATGTSLPGVDLLDNAIDAAVTKLQGEIVEPVFDKLGAAGNRVGLNFNSNGTMEHKDHVGEGDIRGDFSLHQVRGADGNHRPDGHVDSGIHSGMPSISAFEYLNYSHHV
ncbi:hypothetical protein QTH97_05430 [Variovorax sp. J22R24]|uniref:hypothetical protein n=1 Tax=Variovorax gracilis TaxID=3053502 RepID=UPI002575CC70|nr:hypothetical protein [Variovorax sp. J22R24]MDM0104362.1 hypothetical protein [Variovorax sp. J22R24]